MHLAVEDPNNKRRHKRIAADRDVEIRLGDWYTATVRMTDISESGLRITMPGGVLEGQRFRVTLRMGDDELAMTAEVQWVAAAADDHSSVGLSWVHTDDVSNRERLAFFEKITA